MTTRLFQGERLIALADHPKIGARVRSLPPDAMMVLVMDEAGEFVGGWSAFQRWHVEDLWVEHGHRRKSAVGRRLLEAMRNVMAAVKADAVLTFACSSAVRAMIEKQGGRRILATPFVLWGGGR